MNEHNNQQLDDPEDYHRRERLREIHQARQKVGDALTDMDIGGSKGYSISKPDIAHFNHCVALYIQELRTLMSDARTDDDLTELPDDFTHDDVRDFAGSLGRKPDSFEPASIYEAMQVYNQGNHILATVQPLITDGDDEADTDYSDLL